ncbi:MAG: O-antigen ligase family protein [Clostridia bacterium]|nr:O-antigen ligase family protein [Clostridia bacterium]
METMQKNNKNTIGGLFSKLSIDFFYGGLYPAIMAIFTVFCFITKLQLVGELVFVVLACFILLKINDLTPLIPLLADFVFLFYDLDVLDNPLFYVIAAPVLICYVLHVIKFPIKVFNLGQLFLPLCLVTISLMLCGILSPYTDKYVQGLLFTIPLGPVLLAVYLIFANGILYPQGFDIRKWIFYSLLLVGIICTLQYWLLYFKGAIIDGKEEYRVVEIGWCNINVVATMLMIAIPCASYMVVKTKFFVPSILVVLLFYFTIYKTGSDGCLGISLAFLPFLAFFVYKNLYKLPKKIFGWFVYSVILAVVLALLIISAIGKFDRIIDFIVESIKGESGRTKFYMDAIRMFERYPIFGVGFGYYNNYVCSDPGGEFGLFNFHSTFFHVIASSGLVGLCAYVYYFYVRFKILTKHNTPFNLFAFISFAMFTCYGMIDRVEFATVPCMLTLTILLLCCEFANRKGPDLKTLPLQLYGL